MVLVDVCFWDPFQFWRSIFFQHVLLFQLFEGDVVRHQQHICLDGAGGLFCQDFADHFFRTGTEDFHLDIRVILVEGCNELLGIRFRLGGIKDDLSAFPGSFFVRRTAAACCREQGQTSQSQNQRFLFPITHVQ